MLPDQVPHRGQARADGAAGRAGPAPRARAQRAVRRHHAGGARRGAEPHRPGRGCAAARATTRRSTSPGSPSRATWSRSRSPARPRRRSPARIASSHASLDRDLRAHGSRQDRGRGRAGRTCCARGESRSPCRPTRSRSTRGSTCWRPSRRPLERLEHRLVSCVPIDEEFSAGAVRGAGARRDRRAARRRPHADRGGGTGLYLRAALTDLDLRPPPEPDLRDGLERELAEVGPAALHGRLSTADRGAGPSERPQADRAGARARADGHGAAPCAPSSSGRTAAASPGAVRDHDGPRRARARIAARVPRCSPRGAVEEVERALERARRARRARRSASRRSRRTWRASSTSTRCATGSSAATAPTCGASSPGCGSWRAWR